MSTVPSAQRIAFLIGTRPEIVKMSPVLREAKRRRLVFDTIHSGQHYDEAMAGRFFEELRIERPNIAISHAASVGTPQADMVDRLVGELELQFARGRYGLVVVHGDTNTALAGARAAARLEIPIVHVEAGLRCDDLEMVEEQNRREIDGLASWLFVPTGLQLDNLRREGLLTPLRRAHVVGNTIVDALSWMLPRIAAGAAVPRGPRSILLTLHRAENAKREVLWPLLERVVRLSRDLELPVHWPVHPRMRSLLPASIDSAIRVIDPLGWRDFLILLQRARLVLTDSGGVQEEAMVLRRPCVTLRSSTERPETLVLGSNCLVDPCAKLDSLAGAARRMLDCRVPMHPWGDGTSACRILDHLGLHRRPGETGESSENRHGKTQVAESAAASQRAAPGPSLQPGLEASS